MTNEDEIFDRPKLVRLKRAYQKAKMSDKDVFVFDGKEYLVDYAFYLIEYLERKLS